MGTYLSTFYIIKSDKPVEFVVEIGHGQRAESTVYLNDLKIGDNKIDSFSLVLPGTGKDLKRQILNCTTMVRDERVETNETSVTYQLKGGRKDFKEMLQSGVEKHGDVKFYVFNVEFI
ncbi:MAG: hypothetical protein CVT49_10830 [candidate division Zixibacteria bacterium HGW-Zixibacteria-1]|nr:MAG: hypothetical protein CVT49_10830 [candidate division Zixibacteria bacterium HGW-Zixibacteria-1]